MNLKRGHKYKFVAPIYGKLVKKVESGVFCIVQGLIESTSILTYTGNFKFSDNGTTLQVEFLNQMNVTTWLSDSEIENLTSV